MIEQDPRSTQGIMARGANVYNGGSANAYGGKPTVNSAKNRLPEFKKLSLKDVARKVMGNGNR